MNTSVFQPSQACLVQFPYSGVMKEALLDLGGFRTEPPFGMLRLYQLPYQMPLKDCELVILFI